VPNHASLAGGSSNPGAWAGSRLAATARPHGPVGHSTAPAEGVRCLVDATAPVIVIAASAGGLAPLKEIVGALPPGTPAAVFVLLHVSAERPSVLPEILDRLGTLPAAHVVDGEAIASGRVYVAPPGDRHVVVERGVVRLVEGPKERHARPAADVLFRSAAAAYGARVIGVVLSGMDGDGAAGLAHVKDAGGVTVVQAPADATFPGMPESALAASRLDYCLPAEDIGPLLARLVRATWEPPREVA